MTSHTTTCACPARRASANGCRSSNRLRLAFLPRNLAALVGFAIAAAFPPLTSPLAAEPADVAIPMDEHEIRTAGIVTSPVSPERGETELSLPGTVAIPPSQLRVVAAPANGLLEAVLVATDENVVAGQPIARLRSPDLVEAQRQYLAALSDEALSADRLRRTRFLWENRVTPERELRVVETESANAKSRLDERAQILGLMEMSEADIDTLRNSRRILSSVTVHAPISGTVVRREASPGQRVEAAAPVVSIAELDPLWINIQVPASRLPAITVGQAVVIPAYGVQGRVVRIGRTVDASTQSAVAVAEIGSANGAIRAGLAVLATIRISQNGAPQWSVPATSVVRHRDRSWIFVKGPRGFLARPVQVISENARSASVRGALAATDEVADRGVITLLSELAAADKE
ncbi:efflux RND transporter periplasmic adaptor subunit [Bradyrhizobium roseum]|uniref:efflux RND transporter periplasmic adaptor subunit n=1 Tax=Bradyrhizobium roseum TaxID=3056648 RepID=UPI002613813E|nr:efflux RND transporter periplasmic adaptor subunit [Bradyrhizobium roseus]WKA31237.1 efflux RND transporter periplasmic adaptor subunit [Bradyrhizobium roseus]